VSKFACCEKPGTKQTDYWLAFSVGIADGCLSLVSPRLSGVYGAWFGVYGICLLFYISARHLFSVLFLLLKILCDPLSIDRLKLIIGKWHEFISTGIARFWGF